LRHSRLLLLRSGDTPSNHERKHVAVRRHVLGRQLRRQRLVAEGVAHVHL
jgi:hypothetical protein